MSARPQETRTTTGLLLMAAATVFFTGIDTSAKWLLVFGLPTIQVAFARYLGHFLFSLVVFLPSEGIGALRSAAPAKQLLRSIFLLSSSVLNFMALKHLALTVTTTIFFAGPILVSILAIPILGEKVGARRMAAIMVGFSGVLVVVQPWGAEFHPAMLYSICGLFAASMYFIMTRMLSGVESNATQQIWASGIASLCIAPFAFPVWEWPTTPVSWIVLCGIGVFGATGHMLATGAHRLADASLLAPMVYLQVFFATIAGVLVFNNWPTFWTLVGGAIIIASGLYIWNRERQLNKARHAAGQLG